MKSPAETYTFKENLITKYVYKAFCIMQFKLLQTRKNISHNHRVEETASSSSSFALVVLFHFSSFIYHSIWGRKCIKSLSFTLLCSPRRPQSEWRWLWTNSLNPDFSLGWGFPTPSSIPTFQNVELLVIIVSKEGKKFSKLSFHVLHPDLHPLPIIV